MMKFKTCLALALLAALFAVSASADGLPFQLTTWGVFLNPFVAAGAGFDGIALEPNPPINVSPGATVGIKLGSFWLNDETLIGDLIGVKYTGDFNLHVLFTAPLFIHGLAQLQTFSADYTAKAIAGPDTLSVAFEGVPKHFDVGWPDGPGGFTFNIADISMSDGRGGGPTSADLMGSITVDPVPEPGAIVLLGTLLLGVSFLWRRKVQA